MCWYLLVRDFKLGGKIIKRWGSIENAEPVKEGVKRKGSIDNTEPSRVKWYGTIDNAEPEEGTRSSPSVAEHIRRKRGKIEPVARAVQPQLEEDNPTEIITFQATFAGS